MDALHIAIALANKCELFVSTDPDFKDMKSLPMHWLNLSKLKK